MNELDKERKMKKILIASKKDPVFFIEHFCYDTTGHPYKLEPQQKLFLRDKSPYKILFCSRRSGKTLTMIADMLHKAFFRKKNRAFRYHKKQKKNFNIWFCAAYLL